MPQPIPLPRLVPVPPADPPYDEQPRTTGSLALAPQPVRDRRPLAIGTSGSIPDERRLRGLGQALAEILAGRRPPETIQDRMSERAYTELIRAGKMIETPRAPMVGVPHVQSPRPGAVEMCLLVHCGPRSRALAIRLEKFGAQWLITDFETA
ncbi:hypothetical protein GCM10009555_051670 [Acrocarpospora macrocephala]|uniref:Uncharacterized protein n=1 Tax=Acrocarpospora macrocephala TaxID=150177 RepID=A0A5M3WM99_9ACTN|nr:Rv3235 family protein [Acrocarpospora macrocephala]GES09289.1 hypothetical protein Amac_028850 [Acrocarpospora macrocephala]